MGDDFDSFCQQAQIILSGPPLDRQFLSGLWDGADKDLNRAINHLLGLPEEKVIREGQGGGGASPAESKPKKESKSSKKTSKEGKKKEKKEESKPAADDWGGGFFESSAGFPDAGFQTDFASGGFQTGAASFAGMPQPDPGFSSMPGMPQQVQQQAFQTLPPQVQSAPAAQMPSYPDASFGAPFQSQQSQHPQHYSQPSPAQPYGQQMPLTQQPQPQHHHQQPPPFSQGPPLAQPPAHPSIPTSYAQQSMLHPPYSPNPSPGPDFAKMPLGQPYGSPATPSTMWDSESDSENDWWNNPAPLAYHGGAAQPGSEFPTQVGGPGNGFSPVPPQFGSQAAMPGWG